MLQQLGAKEVATSVAATWGHQQSPRQAYERLASRQWSGTWQIPEAIFERAIAKLRNWAVQEYGDRFDMPELEQQGQFFITRAAF